MVKIDKRLELSKERKDELLDDIKDFFNNERDEEIGDLAALLVFEFIQDKIAPEFYNKGIEDAIAYITDRAEDMYGLEIQ